MFGLGIWEVALIAVIALLVLGPEKLPKIARQVGRGVREVRKAAAEFQNSLSMEVQDLEEAQKTRADIVREVRAIEASASPRPTPPAVESAPGGSVDPVQAVPSEPVHIEGPSAPNPVEAEPTDVLKAPTRASSESSQ